VAQVGSRKPVLKVALGRPKGAGAPDSECALPAWEKQPETKVTFQPIGGDKVSFVVRGHSAELQATPDAGEQ
jgi:hypothetical protein